MLKIAGALTYASTRTQVSANAQVLRGRAERLETTARQARAALLRIGRQQQR